MAKVSVVVGAQYGSEAKGHVTAQIIKKANVPGRAVANVRVAGPNAGHTVIDDTGVAWPLRQVPVGAVFTRVPCVIAAGSEIHPEVLLREIADLQAAGHLSQGLYVDGEATVIHNDHILAEKGMHERIGSTGKGIGAARAGRLMRSPGTKRVKDDLNLMDALHHLGVKVDNTALVLQMADHLTDIVIEGTQGYGLGLHAGHYPKCTSSDCRAIDFLAMVGISPWSRWITAFEVWAVARVYPIRVAGNSGYLKNETTWEALNLPEERTTVTKKVRRVGGWDADLVQAAVMANGGSPAVRLAITMLDQKYAEVGGLDGDSSVFLGTDAYHDAKRWLDEVQTDAEAHIRMITTGPSTAVWL